MTKPERLSRSRRVESRGRERMAVRAGRVRIAIGVVGALSGFLVGAAQPFRSIFLAYLLIAVAFNGRSLASSTSASLARW